MTALLLCEWGSGPWRRVLRFAPTPRPTGVEWGLWEAGGGRVRSDAEVVAIERRYARSDSWRTKSASEKLSALRRARAAVAARDRCLESAVSRDALVRFLGLRPNDVPLGFWWSMAGDFSPSR